MDKLVIRKATSCDREAVLRIHDHVYDGHDYLPAYYDHFLSSSDFIPFVMIYDGKIVGFEVIQVVDDGQTQVGRAGRINPKFERQGLIKRFSAWLDEWRIKNNIRRISFTASDANPAVTRPSFQQRNRHVLTKQQPLYCVNVQEISIHPADIEQAKQLQTVSGETLSTYFKSREISSYLSQQGYMIIDMVPLKMTDSNIPFMNGPKGYTTCVSDIRVKDGKCSGLLSFGTTFTIQRPPVHCNLDIFGTDTRTLKEHIIRHLTVIRSKFEGVIGVLVLVQEDFDLQKLDSVFQKFGVKRTIWYDSTYPNLKYSQLYLYYRDFHPSKY